MIEDEKLQQIIEGLLLAAGKPLSVDRIAEVFEENERPDNDTIRSALKSIGDNCAGRGYELKKVASGYRFQVRQELSDWIGRLWEEKPQRYSRALLETLAIIAYRQPLTRGDIEKIRGVAVSSNIIRTLLDREWVRVVGHRDVPGRPAMFATTRAFLDYFNLDSLDQLPTLTEIRDMEEAVNPELSLEQEETGGRVLDFPVEEDESADDMQEHLEEDEAVALATRPLEEILSDDPGREPEQEDNEYLDEDEDEIARSDAERKAEDTDSESETGMDYSRDRQSS